MKHLLTLTALLLTFSGLAQQMPYNPDANGDDFVGVDDVLGVLGVYDTALMQPDLTCDYEGTDLEQLFGGLIAGSLVLDSVYVEIYLTDSVVSFSPECPDPVVEEVVLQRSYMLPLTQYYASLTYSYLEASTDYLDYHRNFRVSYNYDTGSFEFRLYDNEIETLTAYSPHSYSDPMYLTLPFPSTFTLNEDGIQVIWNPYDWAAHCESLKIIPFWHEAE